MIIDKYKYDEYLHLKKHVNNIDSCIIELKSNLNKDIEINNELKEYLLKNNMKLGTIAAMSYSTVGGLANIGIDGQRRSFFTAENNVWLKSIMSNLVLSELSGLLLDVAGYTLIFCGDYNHASIGDNGSFGKVEYTYFLSNMTEEQRQISFKQPTLSDCGYDSYLGDIFYKKKIQVLKLKRKKVEKALRHLVRQAPQVQKQRSKVMNLKEEEFKRKILMSISEKKRVNIFINLIKFIYVKNGLV